MFYILLDRKNAIPLHFQVQSFLRNEILKGTYTEKIPPECELMKRFTVSRDTIRRAIRSLIEDGVLESKQGLGTFIASRPIEEWLGNLSTFFEIVNEMGMKPNIKMLNHGSVNAPQDVAKIFGVDKVYETNRIRLANDIPVVLEKQYYSLELGKQLAALDLNNVSTYDVIESRLGIKLWEAKQTIFAIIPTASEKKLLGLTDEPCCAMLSKRLVTDSDGNPVEYEKSIYRSDMYTFRIKLTRGHRI
jgi:GntR family transcriptional regulator